MERARELEELIRRHQMLYYNEMPELSDEEFDLLWDELRFLEPFNPLFYEVPKDATSTFKKEEHIMPMGSQEKVNSNESFLEWASKQKVKKFLVEYKMDGASLELQYKGGNFVRAVTRGDGKKGDDITENALKMKGLLKELNEYNGEKSSFTGAIRGEVIMPKNVHSTKYKDKANCRNAANGIMKRKDGKGCEDLEIICYDVWQSDGLEGQFFYTNEIEKIEWLKKMGFFTVETKICDDAKDVISYREEVAKKRGDLAFDIDGLVVKNVDLDIEDLKRARPEKQVAFKFDLECAISTIREVEWSESGATYTPIAIIDEVSLAGTKVRRASLANPNVISSFNLKIGSRVLVSKRGEIIPKIESLLENTSTCLPIKTPAFCLSCGSELVNEGTRLYCPNLSCKKKDFHKIKKWLDVLEIKEIGDVLLSHLFEKGKVKKIKDLYTLTVEDIESIERMGELSSQKVYASIHSKKKIRMSEFIAGFDIEDIGLKMAENIENAGISSPEKLFLLKLDELTNIEGFGNKMASSFIASLTRLKNEMQELLESGHICIDDSYKKGGNLTNLSFCFTGELDSMKRKDAENMVRDAGGKVLSAVSKNLSYLVTNTPSSSSTKNKKAKELGIKIISESDFLSLFQNNVKNF